MADVLVRFRGCRCSGMKEGSPGEFEMSFDSGHDRSGCFREFFSEEGNGTPAVDEAVCDGGSTSMATTSSVDPPKVVEAEATTRESLQAGLARLEGEFIERTDNTE